MRKLTSCIEQMNMERDDDDGLGLCFKKEHVCVHLCVLIHDIFSHHHATSMTCDIASYLSVITFSPYPPNKKLTQAQSKYFESNFSNFHRLYCRLSQRISLFSSRTNTSDQPSRAIYRYGIDHQTCHGYKIHHQD